MFRLIENFELAPSGARLVILPNRRLDKVAPLTRVEIERVLCCESLSAEFWSESHVPPDANDALELLEFLRMCPSGVASRPMDVEGVAFELGQTEGSLLYVVAQDGRVLDLGEVPAFDLTTGMTTARDSEGRSFARSFAYWNGLVRQIDLPGKFIRDAALSRRFEYPPGAKSLTLLAAADDQEPEARFDLSRAPGAPRGGRSSATSRRSPSPTGPASFTSPRPTNHASSAQRGASRFDRVRSHSRPRRPSSWSRAQARSYD